MELPPHHIIKLSRAQHELKFLRKGGCNTTTGCVKFFVAESTDYRIVQMIRVRVINKRAVVVDDLFRSLAKGTATS